MAWQEKSPILGFPDRSANVSIPRVLSRFAGLLLVAGAAASLFAFDGRDALGATTQATVQATAKPAFELNDDGSPNVLKLCQEKWFTQTLDHFDVGAPTYEQRYFVCDEFYREDDGVMFFYVGNEADVELYLNHTGLMWENAAEFGAMLVFAEHRYFGKSLPFGDVQEMVAHVEFLSIEQTLTDYAVLITHLKEEVYRKRDLPVVGFGGSYGGMLGSWFRMKYPHIIDGVIAASAPILQYLGDELPPDIGSYARLVTFDATPAAGSAVNCAPNIRRVWPTIRSLGKSEDGRSTLRSALSLCDSTPLTTPADVESLIDWAKGSFDYMSMGNYPYPSSYIMNGQSELPAYPMRVACSHLADEYPGDVELLQAFSQAIGVYYNSTQHAECYQLAASSDESANDANLWDFIFCSQAYGPLSQDGVHDMFWDAPWDYEADNASCQREWGVDADRNWPTVHFGGRRALRAASNLVFSNGNYDPCAGTGVLQSVSESVVALRIEGGAHHLDLMFSNPLDPPAVKYAREVEKQYMRRWIDQAYAHSTEVSSVSRGQSS
jgi:lysosomal Pro-X carboxypeptidase